MLDEWIPHSLTCLPDDFDMDDWVEGEEVSLQYPLRRNVLVGVGLGEMEIEEDWSIENENENEEDANVVESNDDLEDLHEILTD